MIEPEAEDELKVVLRLKVTSSMYSSRSRAFLKSYSLARRLSSQMYSCREARRKTIQREAQETPEPRGPALLAGRRPLTCMRLWALSRGMVSGFCSFSSSSCRGSVSWCSRKRSCSTMSDWTRIYVKIK